MTAPRSRWFRFSLRTLFVLMTVLACWLGWGVNLARQRQAMRKRIETSSFLRMAGEQATPFAHAGRIAVLQEREPDRFRASLFLVGERPCEWIYLSHGAFSPTEQQKICELFPEARVEEGKGAVEWWTRNQPAAQAEQP